MICSGGCASSRSAGSGCRWVSGPVGRASRPMPPARPPPCGLPACGQAGSQVHVGEGVERHLRWREARGGEVEPADLRRRRRLGPGVAQRDERHRGLARPLDVEQRVDERVGESEHERGRDPCRRRNGENVRERGACIPEGVPVGAFPVAPCVAPECARHRQHDGCSGDGRFLPAGLDERGPEVARAHPAQGVVEGAVVRRLPGGRRGRRRRNTARGGRARRCRLPCGSGARGHRAWSRCDRAHRWSRDRACRATPCPGRRST